MAGELRARDVRSMLAGRVDPAVSTVLETIAEQQFFLAKGCMEMGQLVTQMADMMPEFLAIAEKTKGALDTMQRPKDDLGVIVEGEDANG